MRSLMLLMLLFLGACDITTPSFEKGVKFYNVMPYSPPSGYDLIWDWVRECTGTEKDFDDIGWYQADRIDSPPKKDVEGVHVRQNGSIIINRHHLYDSAVVQHEMVHYAMPNWIHTTPRFMFCVTPINVDLSGYM